MKKKPSKFCLTTIVVFHICILSAFSISSNFTYTKRSNCAPAIVTFTNNSTTRTGITYTWDFGLGSTVNASDNSNKEQLYSSAGTYKVTLTASDNSSTVSYSTTITISEGPKAYFTATPLQGCPPLTVNYSSTSIKGSSDITTTAWDFRNSDYGEGSSVAYSYNYAGKYSVVLKVTDKNGCYSLMESDSLITVINKPIVNFKATDTFACTPPLKVTFTNLTTGSTNLTYKWDYGNGETSTDLSNSSVYDSTGTYNVKLTVTNSYGCSDSLIKKSYIRIGNTKGTISIYDSNNQIVNKSILCSGTYKFKFSLGNLPDYTWTVRDNNQTTTIKGQDSLMYLVKDSGKLYITLTYGKNTSCTDSINLTYTKKYIKANFTPDDTLFCSVPKKISLQNTSENADNYSWFLSDNLFSNNSDTSYTITQTDLPTQTYKQLYSRSINSVTLPFKLVVTNTEGCSDSITKEVTISLPVARFMPNKVSGCTPLLVSFSDSSKSAFTINQYIYKIGTNIITSVNKIPVTYTFTKPGEYYVTEIIKSESCYDTSNVVKIVVGEKLIPDLTVLPSKVCNGASLQITGNSNNNSAVNTWQIQSPGMFDYHFTSKPDTLITVYSDSAGFKNVSLLLDYNGCQSDTTKKSIFEIIGPTGNFTESFSCDSPLVYHFKSNIKPAISLIWNVDTATLNNVDSLRFKFSTGGDYTVKLTATDISTNCSLTKTKTIKVRQVKAAFTVNDSIFCAGDSITLNASSSKDYINSCYNEGFLWDFGDDSPSKRTFLNTYTHVYSKKGIDTILLVTTADNGCTDSLKKIVYVYKPEAIFTADKDTGCVSNLNVLFTNTSTDTTIVNWIWNFGDNSVDSTKTILVKHNYSSDVAKTFRPTLIVYDAYQCYSNYSLPITLIAINSDFQADDNALCIGQTATFTPIDNTLDSLYWNFGDSNTSTASSAHTFNIMGEYSVSLTASKNGCRDTVTKLNYISVEKANANFTMSDSILYCYPDTVYFSHNNLIGSPAIDRLWTFDKQTMTGKNTDSIKYIFTKPGTYTNQLTVTTLNNCTASNSKSLVITGPTATYSFSPPKICYNEIVNFKIDSSSNITEWKWLFGDGNTSTDNPASHRYTTRGTLTPSILLINKTCSVTSVIDTLHVSQVEANFNNAANNLNICYGSKLNLINSSTYSTSWNWEIDNVSTSTEFNLTDISLSKIGNYYIKLIAMDDDNCSDTLTKTYAVVANPVFSIIGDSILCVNQDSIVLTVNKETGWGIVWSPTTGISNSVAFITVAKPTVTTTYTALVTDANGCTATREKTIVLNQPYDFSRIPLGDTTINIGDKIQLLVSTDASNVKYSWSPNYNISCLSCYNPMVWPTKDFTYIVEMKNNCFDVTESFNIKVIIDFYLEAPSAFSPNGDSYNDIYKLEENNIKTFDLKIFNRWGQLVFSTNDVTAGWDGKVNGNIQNIDTYTYYVKAETTSGYKFEKKGSFLLLK